MTGCGGGSSGADALSESVPGSTGSGRQAATGATPAGCRPSAATAARALSAPTPGRAVEAAVGTTGAAEVRLASTTV